MGKGTWALWHTHQQPPKHPHHIQQTVLQQAHENHNGNTTIPQWHARPCHPSIHHHRSNTHQEAQQLLCRMMHHYSTTYLPWMRLLHQGRYCQRPAMGSPHNKGSSTNLPTDSIPPTSQRLHSTCMAMGEQMGRHSCHLGRVHRLSLHGMPHLTPRAALRWRLTFLHPAHQVGGVVTGDGYRQGQWWFCCVCVCVCHAQHAFLLLGVRDCCMHCYSSHAYVHTHSPIPLAQCTLMYHS